jgi:hypothetical protein
MAQGRSMFMDIRSQYFTQLPYEGHHREYVAQELIWMMEQIGCADVRLHSFDSNMLQFTKIDRPHLECLRAFVHDPEQADTLLVSGIVNPDGSARA